MRDSVDPGLLDLFLRLAAIEGRSGRERAVADFVLTFLRDLGLDAREGDRPGDGCDAGNVVCTIGDGGNRVLLAHLDTARSTRDLQPEVRSDRVVSDGTTVLGVDNRAGVAAILHAARRVRNSGGAAVPCTLAFTVCEETTLAGSRALRLASPVRMGFVFDSALRPGHVVVDSPGAQRFRVEVVGRAAHAGIAPEQGVDALRVASRAVASAPIGRIDPETTANVGRFVAGSGINVVPDRAEVEGEVRSKDVARIEAVLASIRSRFDAEARAAGATLAFERAWDFRPYRIAPDAPVRLRAFAALEAVGLSPRPAASSGGSDANSLNEAGVPTVNLGIGAQNPHGDDETILLEDLAAASAIAFDLMTRA